MKKNHAMMVRSKINKLLTNRNLLIIFCLIHLNISTFGQQEQFQSATVAFYNVENLFDIEESVGFINGEKDPTDPEFHTSISVEMAEEMGLKKITKRLTFDNLKGEKGLRHLILADEFTPEGEVKFTKEQYLQKINNIVKVIHEIGKSSTGPIPAIVGLAEIENEHVMRDLVAAKGMEHYGFVHYNSFDERGIDCALLYDKRRFVLEHSERFVLELFDDNGAKRDYTRDILLVSGKLDGEMFHFLVNHWPSRSGGQAASEHKRVAAGKLLRSIIDNIQKNDREAKIIAMGDFNDDPTDKSIQVLNVKEKRRATKNEALYNPMIKMHKKGNGSLAWRDSWNLFDQLIFSAPLTKRDYVDYQIFKTSIFSPDYLIQQEGKYKGYPNRSFDWGTYDPYGFSDHFPVYTTLIRKVK